MKPNLYLRMLRTGALLGCLLWTGRCFAEKISDIEEAYRYLSSTESTWHDGPTPKDLEALAVLKGNLEATKRMFVKTFLEGAKEDGPAGTLILLFPADERLDVLREVVRHYEYGDITTPFTGALAASGTSDDMAIIKGIFIRHPNADGVGELAGTMASSKNPRAHDALVEFSKEIPGKWQERFGVRKFLAARAEKEKWDVTPTEPSPIQATADKPQERVGQAPGALPVAQPHAPAQTKTSTEGIARWWILVGIVMIVAGLLYFLGVARKHRRKSDAGEPGGAAD